MASTLDDVATENINYLYKITNLVNGKMYIGVTVTPRKREREHLQENKRNKNPLIKQAIAKYGVENLKFEVICIGDRDYIYDLEAKAIELYGTLAVGSSEEGGYNLKPGGQGGLGGKVSKRSDDYPCYVRGFWFPNKRIACSKMRITNTNAFYKKLKDGTLGDVVSKTKGSIAGNEIYYKGFWWPTAHKAAEVLSMSKATILLNIKRNKIEEDFAVETIHPKRKLEIDGRVYENLKHASEDMGVSEYTLKSRFYINKPGYKYVYK